MRLRLILSFALIVLVSVSSVVFMARYGAAQEVRSFMFHGGMAGARDLVATLEDHYQYHHTWEGAEVWFESPGGRSGMGLGMMGMMGQRVRLADAEGNILIDTDTQVRSGRLSAAELQRAIPLRADSKVAGYLLLEGGMTFSANDETFLLARLTRAAVAAGLIAGALSLLLALLLAYSLARPLRSLTQAAGQLAQGDLSQRVAIRGRDELARLGQAFNHMATSLQQAVASRRAMTADIAHELRTPLAVQRAHLEALQDGIYPLTAENLTPIQEQNLLLTRLVDDLRTLALADAGQLTLERTPTDFPTLVQSVVKRFEPQAAARRIDLHLDLPSVRLPSASVDPLRVEQILSNLLTNALRYTPEGGQIECRVRGEVAGQQSFSIHDSGPGIPSESLAHVFERFYRVDRSRSRTEGGTGLGLAIARQLAQAHGGSLTVANHPHGGAIFSLTLPFGSET